MIAASSAVQVVIAVSVLVLAAQVVVGWVQVRRLRRRVKDAYRLRADAEAARQRGETDLAETRRTAAAWREHAALALLAQRWMRNGVDQRETGPTTWRAALAGAATAALLSESRAAFESLLEPYAAPAEGPPGTPAEQAGLPYREVLRELRAFEALPDARVLELCAAPRLPGDRWDAAALGAGARRAMAESARAALAIAAERLGVRAADE